MSELLIDLIRRSGQAANKLRYQFEKTRLGVSVGELQRRSELANQLRDQAKQLGRNLFDQSILEGFEATDEVIAETAEKNKLSVFEEEVWLGSLGRKGEVCDAGNKLLKRLGKKPTEYTVVSEEDWKIATALVLFDGVLETLLNSAGLEGVSERFVLEDTTPQEVVDQKVSELVLVDRVSVPPEDFDGHLVRLGLFTSDEVGELHITTEARDMVAWLVFGK